MANFGCFRYSAALARISRLSWANPSITLQLLQSNPLITSVVWQWSTDRFLPVISCNATFLARTAPRVEIIHGVLNLATLFALLVHIVKNVWGRTTPWRFTVSFDHVYCFSTMKNSKPITVGLELEMTRLSVGAGQFYERQNFGRRTDASILDNAGNPLPKSGPNAGVEFVTPILSVDTSLSADGDSDEFDFSGIQPVIRDLCACAGQINSSCGLHVHLGRPNGEKTEWNPRRLPHQVGGPMSEWKPGHVRTMLLIGLGLENTIFSLVPDSRRQCRHCRRIREIYDGQAIQSYYPVNNLRPRKHENPQRYCWMNLIETRRPADPEEERVGYARSKAFGTIEVRALGETANYEYVEAWVEMWVKIAAAVAYLPAESAALRCLYSGWLQPDIDRLMRLKEFHEQHDALSNRSTLPTASMAAVANGHNGNGE